MSDRSGGVSESVDQRRDLLAGVVDRRRVAGHAGLTAIGGSAGVGWATTRAVVNTSFAVIVLDFILSGVGFVFFR